MAVIETWFKQDLNTAVKPRSFPGEVFNNDSLGNLIGVEVTKDGQAVSLTGSVNGYCILADGETIPVAGTRSGNKASIILPHTAYSVRGIIKISIKITDGQATTTLLQVVGAVDQSVTGNMVNPGSVVQDWSQQIAAAMQELHDLENNYVRVDTASQGLTETKKSNGRTNIDAANVADVNNLKSAFDSVTEVLNYFHVNDGYSNGVTLTNVENGIKLNGTAGSDNSAKDSPFEIGYLDPGIYTAKYSAVSGEISGSNTSGITLRFGTGNGTRWLNPSHAEVTNTDVTSGQGFTSSTRVFLNFNRGIVFNDYILQYQISKGTTAGVFSPNPLNAIDLTARGGLISVDNTLTQSGDAADAKVTGDAITAINDNLYNEPVYNINRLTIKRGNFNSSFGTGNDTRRLRAEKYIRMVNGTKLHFEIGPLYYQVVLFDSQKTYLGASEWITDKDYTVDLSTALDGYVGIQFANGDTYGHSTAIVVDDFLPEYSVSIDYVSDIYQDITDIHNAIMNDTAILPDYWEQYIESKIAEILPYYSDTQLNGDAFIFLTDYHHDPNRPTQTNNGWSHLIVKRIMHDLPIDMFVFGGDVINGNASKTLALNYMQEVSRRFSGIDVYGVRGNHDYNVNDGGSSEVKLSDSVFYTLFTKGVEDKITLASSYTGYANAKLDYFYDNTAQKIRYIFMDTRNEASTSEGGIITATQIEWMQNRITELSSDWSVIIFAHQYFAKYSSLPQNPTPGDTTMYRQNHKLFDGISAILGAASCTVIGIITGHIHADYSYDGNGFLEIATTTDSMQIGSTTINPGYAVGTSGEQAFDVFVLDKTYRKLKAFRIGHGQNREWTY